MAVERTEARHGVLLQKKYEPLFSEGEHRVEWLEVITEQFLGSGERQEWLESVGRSHPLSLHGVTLSIGSADPLNSQYLGKLRQLVDRLKPVYVSDHLAWSSLKGFELSNLLPLPYTREALEHVLGRVRQVQDALDRQILLENPSTYLAFDGAEMTEAEFISEVAERADCGILLDINNIYVSSTNQGFDASIYLSTVPKERICQFHLAGHDKKSDVLIDTHRGPIPEEVWSLYKKAIRRFGRVSTIIEWDTGVPEWEVLIQERNKVADFERTTLQ